MSTQNKVLKVCRIEYETKDGTNWKANILAFSMEDALKYIINNVRGYDRYISTNMIGDVNAIETNAYKAYFNTEPQVVETIIKHDPDNTKDITCPWCDKSFKNTNTLGNHIRKFHLE